MKKIKLNKKAKIIGTIIFYSFLFIFSYSLLKLQGEKNLMNQLAVMLEDDDGNWVKSEFTSFSQEDYEFDHADCLYGSTVTANPNGGFNISFARADKCTIYLSQNKADFQIKGITINGVSATGNIPMSGYIVTPNCGTVPATWDYNNWKLEVSPAGQKSIKCSLEFTTVNSTTNPTIKSVVKSAIVTQTKATVNGAEVNTGFRYTGTDPKNYVKFNNEMWRIIGSLPVKDKNAEDSAMASQDTNDYLVKIIREESIGSYAFETSNKNYWEKTDGTKATANTILNTYYYGYDDNGTIKYNGTSDSACKFYMTSVNANCDFSAKGVHGISRNMVEEVKWYFRGTSSAPSTGEAAYEIEVSTKGTVNDTTNYKVESAGYIGVMYPSDYLYAGGKNGWLLKNGLEWMLSPNASYSYGVWRVSDYGGVYSYSAYYGYALRPVLYLKSNVYKVAGDGTKTNPYILGM